MGKRGNMGEEKEESQLCRIAGTVIAPASGEPVLEVTVTVRVPGLAEDLDLGRAVTAKDGRYEVEIEPKRLENLTLNAAMPLSVVLKLSDAKGRTILTTGQPVLMRRGADVRIDVAAPHLEHGLDWPDMTYLAGQPVNLAAAAQLTTPDLVQTYLFLRGRAKNLERGELVRRVLPGLFARRDLDDACAEGRFEVIRALLAERGQQDALTDTDADDLSSGETVHWFYTPHIQVKYTTDAGSPNQVVSPVPTADAPVNLSNGTTIGWVRANLSALNPSGMTPQNTEVPPTFVQEVGVIAEHALTQYLSTAFGVRDPRAGASRLEYRILDQNPGILPGQQRVYGQTHPSWSHVEVDPHNSLLQNLHTVPHEMFHRVQYRYNNISTISGLYGMMREGGARFIEDCINDQPNRYVPSAKKIFDDPTQSLADSPSVGTSSVSSTPINKASGLFWKYMAEQHSTRVGPVFEPAVGVDAYRQALEASATVAPGDPGVGYDPSTLRTARGNMPYYGSFDQFFYYDPAQTELGSHETTWGNYLIANYLHGTASPVTDPRFDYLEDDEPVTWPDPANVPNLAALQATVLAGDDIALAQGSNVTRSVTGHNAWAARYYRITPSGSPGPRLLRVTFNASGGMTDPLVQILLLGPGNALVDIHRSDKTNYTKTVNLAGLSSVIVIVASRGNPGGFTVQFDEMPIAADTMITRWNSAGGTEYESNPYGWSWTWVSPDVMVDNNNDGLADTAVHFGVNNVLKVRLRNRGNQVASNIQIDFWYQKATPFLTSTGWTPVRNSAGNIQQLTGQTLAAKGDPAGNDVKWFSVNWAPVDDGTHHPHWCVKVKVSVPGEPNSDNKLALSNFSNVVPSGDRDMLGLLVRLPEPWAQVDLLIVPHGPRWSMLAGRFPKSSARPRASMLEKEPAARVLMPCEAIMADLTLVRRRIAPWDERDRKPRPLPGRYYRVDPRTLPPGVNPETLVTVAQVVDGRLTGGVTFQITPKGS